MTKEELEKEAEKSFEQYKVTDEDYVVSPYSDDMGEKMLMYNYEYYAEETYSRFYIQGYLAGAEPREKRIAELETTNKRISDECHKLVGSLEKKQNEIVELIGKVAFLENDLNNAKAQIEKMKCCGNCRFSENDKLNGTFCHREGCFVVASAKCKLWEN